jgi:hypothetical protein
MSTDPLLNIPHFSDELIRLPDVQTPDKECKLEPLLADRLIKFLPAYQDNPCFYHDHDIKALGQTLVAKNDKEL